jgi:hypothetical protein
MMGAKEICKGWGRRGSRGQGRLWNQAGRAGTQGDRKWEILVRRSQ